MVVMSFPATSQQKQMLNRLFAYVYGQEHQIHALSEHSYRFYASVGRKQSVIWNTWADIEEAS
jgi:hypothetical protein